MQYSDQAERYYVPEFAPGQGYAPQVAGCRDDPIRGNADEYFEYGAYGGRVINVSIREYFEEPGNPCSRKSASAAGSYSRNYDNSAAESYSQPFDDFSQPGYSQPAYAQPAQSYNGYPTAYDQQAPSPRSSGRLSPTRTPAPKPKARAARPSGGQNSGLYRSSGPSGSRPYYGMRVAEKSSRVYGSILKVTNVSPGGPAQRAGIMVGDVLHKFCGVDLVSQEQLSQLMAQSKPGATVLFEVDRKRNREFITLTVEGPGGASGSYGSSGSFGRSLDAGLDSSLFPRNIPSQPPAAPAGDYYSPEVNYPAAPAGQPAGAASVNSYGGSYVPGRYAGAPGGAGGYPVAPAYTSGNTFGNYDPAGAGYS